MEKDLQTGLSKSQYHASFIYDILKKEYQSDALRSLSKESKNKANNIRREGKQNIENAAYILQGAKEFAKRANSEIQVREKELSLITQYKQADGTYPIEYQPIYETRYRKLRKKFFSLTRAPVIFILASSLSLFVVGILTELMSLPILIFPALMLFFSLIINSLYVLFVREDEEYVVQTGQVNRFQTYPSDENIANHKLQDAKKNYERAKSNLVLRQTQYETALADQLLYDRQASDMDKYAERLEEFAKRLKIDQQNMLNMDVIPPDYRNLKCLFELYRIFYNNLADTMREAIMIYEDRVFKGIIVREMREYNNKLGLISEYILDVRDELYRISYDTNLMGKEIQNIYEDIQHIRENQSAQNHRQDQMIEELRATRYANEVVKESQERCEWYKRYDFWYK
ncbi:MAG: hypothetical protein IKM00_02660 [Clostridia bacterium]|nr:hypothetical protein [Clostridia bacterium]